jgi:DNA-binding IclR family transcriptional regulator
VSPRKVVEREFIRSSAKLFEALELFATKGRDQIVSLKRVVEELGYPKTTVHRLVYSLHKLGYLQRGGLGGSYRLGPRFFQLVDGKLHYHRLQTVSRPVMESLAKKVQETVNLGVLERDEILLLDVVDSPNAFRWVSHPGERSLIHNTALGKAVAAFLSVDELDDVLNRKGFTRATPHTLPSRRALSRQLESVRRDLIAFDDEETVEGIQCVASPIFDKSSEVVGALSISAPKIRMAMHTENAKTSVREAARKISVLLGYQVPKDQMG